MLRPAPALSIAAFVLVALSGVLLMPATVEAQLNVQWTNLSPDPGDVDMHSDLIDFELMRFRLTPSGTGTTTLLTFDINLVVVDAVIADNVVGMEVWMTGDPDDMLIQNVPVPSANNLINVNQLVDADAGTPLEFYVLVSLDEGDIDFDDIEIDPTLELQLDAPTWSTDPDTQTGEAIPFSAGPFDFLPLDWEVSCAQDNPGNQNVEPDTDNVEVGRWEFQAQRDLILNSVEFFVGDSTGDVLNHVTQWRLRNSVDPENPAIAVPDGGSIEFVLPVSIPIDEDPVEDIFFWIEIDLNDQAVPGQRFECEVFGAEGASQSPPPDPPGDDIDMTGATESSVITIVEPFVPNAELTFQTGPTGLEIVDAGTLGEVALDLAVSATGNEPVRLESLTFSVSGSGTDHVDITNVALVRDNDNDGVVDTPEPVLANGTFLADDGDIVLLPTFNGGPTIDLDPAGQNEVHFLVTFDFSPDAPGGETYRLELTGATATPLGEDVDVDFEPTVFQNMFGDELVIAIPPGLLTVQSLTPADVEGLPGTWVMGIYQISATLGDVNLQSVFMTAQGSGNDQTGITSVRVVLDADLDGNFTLADTVLGTAIYEDDNGQAILGIGPLVLARDTSAQLLVVYEVSPLAENGSQFGATLNAITLGGDSTTTGLPLLTRSLTIDLPTIGPGTDNRGIQCRPVPGTPASTLAPAVWWLPAVVLLGLAIARRRFAP